MSKAWQDAEYQVQAVEHFLDRMPEANREEFHWWAERLMALDTLLLGHAVLELLAAQLGVPAHVEATPRV